jgi:hypothetical protein
VDIGITGLIANIVNISMSQLSHISFEIYSNRNTWDEDDSTYFTHGLPHDIVTCPGFSDE